jgi:hypothetical protein
MTESTHRQTRGEMWQPVTCCMGIAVAQDAAWWSSWDNDACADTALARAPADRSHLNRVAHYCSHDGGAMLLDSVPCACRSPTVHCWANEWVTYWGTIIELMHMLKWVAACLKTTCLLSTQTSYLWSMSSFWSLQSKLPQSLSWLACPILKVCAVHWFTAPHVSFTSFISTRSIFWSCMHRTIFTSPIHNGSGYWSGFCAFEARLIFGSMAIISAAGRLPPPHPEVTYQQLI